MHTQEHNDYVEGLHLKLSKDQGNKSMDIEQVCKVLCGNSSVSEVKCIDFCR